MNLIPKLNDQTLRFHFPRLKQEEASLQRLLESVRQQQADLKKRAIDEGLGALYRDLEHPPAPVARVEEPTVRVRVIESFSQEWRNFPYDGIQGSVMDIPKSFAKRARHLFEEVDAATPLHVVRPEAPYAR